MTTVHDFDRTALATQANDLDQTGFATLADPAFGSDASPEPIAPAAKRKPIDKLVVAAGLVGAIGAGAALWMVLTGHSSQPRTTAVQSSTAPAAAPAAAIAAPAPTPDNGPAPAPAVWRGLVRLPK
jgi:hypothetical protein